MPLDRADNRLGVHDVSVFEDEFTTHLADIGPAPFLFVGAGLSRRYIGLEDWKGLLEKYSKVAGRSYDYYSASANEDLPQIATLIAADLHEPWWEDPPRPEFAATREMFPGPLKSKESALKAEVARHVNGQMGKLSTKKLHAQELDLFKAAVVDGIVTTNYDPLMEHLFPEFKTYVGEEGLLFSDAQGLGEIYKIHGSHEDPDSLVLTKSDYDLFQARKPYLAAKLLTIFVERPVIFLGYSLGDENVIEILRSIAAVLTRDRIGQLQDRLIFVEWVSGLEKPTMAPTAVPVDGGFSIPMQHVRIGDFTEVFAALTQLDRRFSVRVLRHLREHVYELVNGEDPNGRRVYVQDLDTDADLNAADFVFGVGAIDKFTESYKGKNRRDLLNDVVEAGNLRAESVIRDVLPSIPLAHHVPVYKYLRESGLLNDDGELLEPDLSDKKIADRVELGSSKFRAPDGYHRKRAEEACSEVESLGELISNHDPEHVLLWVGELDPAKIDPESLRLFLLETRQSEFGGGQGLRPTQWAKAVCFYDWLSFGPK